MNILHGKIKTVDQSGAVTVVEIDIDGDIITSIIINTGEENSWIKTGGETTVVFKETEVSLAKNLTGLISLRNRLKGRVVAITEGKILSKVEMVFKNNHIESIITTQSLLALVVKVDDEIEALIKANEITLIKC